MTLPFQAIFACGFASARYARLRFATRLSIPNLQKRIYTNKSSEVILTGLCVDNDGDGYGNPASHDCLHPELDCNDNDASIHPGASEVCDYKDNDCDGLCFGGSNNGGVCLSSGSCPGGSCVKVDEDFNYNGRPVGASCDGIGECGGGGVFCVDENTADCSTNPGRPDYDGSVEV